MDRDDRLYRNLVILLKIFKNRPNHLAKYLIDNTALSESFIQSIINSKKLNDISSKDSDYFQDYMINQPNYFTNYEEMNDYYNSIMIGSKMISDKSELTKELNEKLNKFIEEENYEEAVKIRDYMINNNIPIDQ